MKEYVIEYADHGLLVKSCALICGCLLAIIMSIMGLAPDEIVCSSSALAGIVMSLIYLLANPPKIRKTGIILISDNRIVFGLAGGIKVIDLRELAKCQIAHYDGTILTLIPKNGSKFRIMANNNLCDASKLTQACHDIEMAIHEAQLRFMKEAIR